MKSPCEIRGQVTTTSTVALLASIAVTWKVTCP
jgi:hypothetical protein